MTLHGWLIVDKPVGIGSTQVVGAVKRALREGGYPKVKVGHGGTLDPLASGVLPIALGEATKLSGRMLDADKVYEFTIGFGVETDTLDLEGEKVERSDVRPRLAEVEAVLPRFTGEIEQVPPAYSALKVDGKRAYDLARAGEAPEMKARRVRVHSLKILPGTGEAGMGGPRQPKIAPGERSTRLRTARSAVEGAAGSTANPLHHSPSANGPPPSAGRPVPRTGLGLPGAIQPADPGEDQVTLLAAVSKGTYIRSLARDIARAAGTVGHVTMLRRLKAGPFTLERAISLDKLADLAKARRLEQALLPLTAGLDDIPALPVTPDQASRLRQGRTLAGIAAKPGLHLATDESVPVALVELSEGELRVVRGFNL